MMRIPPPALAGLVAGLQASALALVNRASPAAAGRRVVIVGGGDTGADCLGTAHWQGAKEAHQFELLPHRKFERRMTNEQHNALDSSAFTLHF